MKNYLYLLVLSFSLISCYTYRVKAEGDGKPKDTQEMQTQSAEIANKERLNSQPSVPATISKNSKIPKLDKIKSQNQNQPQNIQEKLEANKYFKIEVGGRPYKVQVDKWENDTLIAHVINKPKKILKFHKNQINESTIAERRFSQPTADIITVVAYAAIGLGIFALVK